MISNSSFSKTDEYCINGDYGVKFIIPVSTTKYLGFQLSDLTNCYGKSIKYSANVKTDHPIRLTIIVTYSDGSSDTAYNATINPPDSSMNVITTSPIPNNASAIHFRINGTCNTDEDWVVFTDNWSLEEV